MKRVLIIEDDQWLGDSYERLLRQSGLAVLRASNAELAMQQIEERSPDVVIADVMLEGHTVFTLLHELQSYDDTRLLPIILCSNIDHEILTGVRLDQYGVCRVLDKALLDPQELVAVVKEYA